MILGTVLIVAVFVCAVSAFDSFITAPFTPPITWLESHHEQHLPKLDWWQNGIFYQIYPRSFKDSNGNGVGDLKGIIEKLPYLKELGIDGAWLSPIFKSPMADHGYDIEDFYSIDPLFGTNADAVELFKKAKELGIKIILDFVPNHTSNQSQWFLKSIDKHPDFKDYYIWHDGKRLPSGERLPPNNWVSVFYGSAWTWNAKRQQFYLHQFAKEQPDLNFRNPKVVEEMKNVLRFWLKKGAAGFRIDAINHLYEDEHFRDEPPSGRTNDPLSYEYLRHDYTIDFDEVYEMIYQWRELTDKWQMDNGGDSRILMSEAYVNLTEWPRYFASRNNKSRLGAQMPFNFNPLMLLKMNSTANNFQKVINDVIASVANGTRLNWVMGNHDRARYGSRFGAEKIDSVLTLVMTLPGIAVTYYGEEIGMLDFRNGISYAETQDPHACNLNETSNWRELSRDPARTPMQWDSSKWAGFSKGDKRPWLPVHTNYRDVNVDLQKKFIRSTLKYYKNLVALRKQPTFAHGSYESKVLNDNVFAYVRALPEHPTYVVLLNLGAREELVDVTQLTAHFGSNVKVAVAGSDTNYNPGVLQPTKSVYLRKYNAIVVTNNSNGIVSSLAIIILSVLIGQFMF